MTGRGVPPRRAHAPPAVVDDRQALLGERGHLGRDREPLGAGHAQDAQPLALVQRQREGDRPDHEVHAAGDDLLQRGPGALERDAGHRDAGQLLELLRQHLGHRAGADAAVVQLTGARPGVGDECLQVGGRHFVRGGERVVRLRDQADRRQVLDLVGDALIEKRIERIDVGAQQQRVPVRRLRQHIVRRDHAGGAGLVLHHHRLAERNAQLVGDQARRDVARAAGGEADDHADVLARKLLRFGGERAQRKQQPGQGFHASILYGKSPGSARLAGRNRPPGRAAGRCGAPTGTSSSARSASST